MNDDDVKAVVVRVNSGGGSAYASEQIWHQITELKAKKPVVISMGGKAASGGYYMSCNANWIVAEPTTLTGSIGIFGMIPDRSQLLTQKLGIKFDEVKTNKNSTMGSSARPMNEEEIGYLQNYIIRGYSLFRQRVADGRKLQVNDVEKIAQGHVFLGQDAMKIKLVDQLGGLDVAVAKAAKLAKMKEYYTCSYPEQADWLSQLMSASSNSNYLDEQMRAAMGEYYEPFMLLKQMNQLDAIQARIPFFLNIK
jgi:protease-4